VFQPDPSIRFVPAVREQVVAIVESINQPQVSVPGKAPQAVVGHLCGLRNANGTLSIFVSLHLPKTGENVVYVHDRRQLSVEEYRTVEVEGLQFLESMGFMLDNLNFRNLAAPMQDQTLARIPLFSPPRPPPPAAAASSATPAPGAHGTYGAQLAPAAAPPVDLGRVARLLAAF
jgi:hypothetical protein